MRILFDHNMPKRLRRHLIGHEVKTTREMRWEDLANGSLLRAAATDRFEVLLTLDKKIEHEQNLRKLPIAVVVLDARSNALPMLTPFVAPLLKLLETPLERALFILLPDGSTLRLVSPRQS